MIVFLKSYQRVFFLNKKIAFKSDFIIFLFEKERREREKRKERREKKRKRKGMEEKAFYSVCFQKKERRGMKGKGRKRGGEMGKRKRKKREKGEKKEGKRKDKGTSPPSRIKR